MNILLMDSNLKILNNKWILSIVILITVNLGLFIYNKYRTSNFLNINSNIQQSDVQLILQIYNELSEINFVNLDENNVKIEDVLSIKKPKLLIFLNPGDCPSCLKEIRLWNRIYLDLNIPVIGIVSDYDIKRIKMFAINENIKFSLWLDFEQHLSIRMVDSFETPIKLLLGEDNDILSITKSFLNQKHEEAYFNYIEELTE